MAIDIITIGYNIMSLIAFIIAFDYYRKETTNKAIFWMLCAIFTIVLSFSLVQ